MAERKTRPMMRELERCVRGEYRDMPGHRLTTAQASRLWAVDETVSVAVLDRLVARGFLRRVGPYYFRADYAQRCA